MNKKQKFLVWGAVIVILMAAMLVWASFNPRILSSVKTISVTVIHMDTTEYTEEIKTTGRTLAEALTEQELIYVDDWGGGPFILSADGEILNGRSGWVWTFYMNGEEPIFDVTTQPIADGDIVYIFPVVY